MSSQSIPLNIGKRVDPDYCKILKNKLRTLLKTNKAFPGTKTVSFERKHLDLLEKEDYYVCERSTGKRFVLFFFHSSKCPATFLLDSNQTWYHIPDLVFPVRKKDNEYLKDTVLDGELIQKKKNTWKFRVFDAMVVDGYDITQRSLNSRLGWAQQVAIEPFNLKYQASSSISIELKKMELSYGVHLVLNKIPSHQSIVWAPVNQPYTMGVSDKLLSWTPPELNRAYLRLTAKWSTDHKPVYALDVTKGKNYMFYDHFCPGYTLGFEWKDKVPFDRVGEFRYDPEWKVTIYEPGYAPVIRKGGWRFISFCDRSTEANNKETADNIQRQVVEEQEVTRGQLVSHVDRVRAAWKARKDGPQPPLTSPSPPPPSNSSLTPPVEHSTQDVSNDTLDATPISISPFNSPLVPSLSEQEHTHSQKQVAEPIPQEVTKPSQEESAEFIQSEATEPIQEEFYELNQEEAAGSVSMETASSTQIEATEPIQEESAESIQEEATGSTLEETVNSIQEESNPPKEIIIIDDDDDDDNDILMQSNEAIIMADEPLNTPPMYDPSDNRARSTPPIKRCIKVLPTRCPKTVLTSIGDMKMADAYTTLYPSSFIDTAPFTHMNEHPLNPPKASFISRTRPRSLYEIDTPPEYDARSKRSRSYSGDCMLPIVRRPSSFSEPLGIVPYPPLGYAENPESLVVKSHTNLPYPDIYQQHKKVSSVKSKLEFILN